MSSGSTPSSRVLQGQRQVQKSATSDPQPLFEDSTLQDIVATGSKTTRKRKKPSAGSDTGKTCSRSSSNLPPRFYLFLNLSSKLFPDYMQSFLCDKGRRNLVSNKTYPSV